MLSKKTPKFLWSQRCWVVGLHNVGTCRNQVIICLVWDCISDKLQSSGLGNVPNNSTTTPCTYMPPSAAWSAKAGRWISCAQLSLQAGLECGQHRCNHISSPKSNYMLRSWLCFLFEQPAPSREFPRWLQGIIQTKLTDRILTAWSGRDVSAA